MDLISFSDRAWREVEDREAVSRRTGEIDGRLSVGNDVRLRERSLPMYDRVRLLTLTCPEWGDLRICYLDDDGNLYRLNGTSTPIHEVNAKAPIRLTDDNVLYYLSFFCLFVHGPEGPYYVLHDLSDELVTRHVDTPDANQQSIRRLFRTPKVLGRDESGRWRISGMIYYGASVFLADFVVQPTGMIEMVDDEPLVEELLGRVTVPLVSSANQ